MKVWTNMLFMNYIFNINSKAQKTLTSRLISVGEDPYTVTLLHRYRADSVLLARS